MMTRQDYISEEEGFHNDGCSTGSRSPFIPLHTPGHVDSAATISRTIMSLVF